MNSPRNHGDFNGRPRKPAVPENMLYGIHAVEEAVRTRPECLEKVYFDTAKHADTLYGLLKECRRLRITYHVVPSQKIDWLCPGVNHQGVVAQCPIKSYGNWEEILGAAEKRSTAPLFLLPASVEDTGNLGAIIRSAAAFGVDAILLEQRNTAPLGPAAAKAAAGGIEKVEIVRPKNLEGVVAGLKNRGYAIIGADAESKKTPGQIDFTGPSVIITGGEDRGIPPYLRKQCTAVAGIPITGAVSSLNVSVAAGIMLYECSSQRIRKQS